MHHRKKNRRSASLLQLPCCTKGRRKIKAGKRGRLRSRWSRPRVVSPCRQDTRVEAVRQSTRASSPRPAASARTATARDPGVCAAAAADGLGLPPGPAPYRRDRGGLACGCEPTRGSRCWGRVPTPSPSSDASGRRPGPDSRSHALPYSSACNISFAWQHRNPSGPVVLHLELEIKVCLICLVWLIEPDRPIPADQ